MDIPDDFVPDQAAPAAVVRRRGESYDQLDARKAGYSDAQIGYGNRSFSSSRGGNPLERAYRLSLAREKEANDVAQDAKKMSIDERSLALREKEFKAQERIHASAQSDKKAALDQMGYLLDEQDQLAEKHGRGTREYMLGALSLAKKYPAAIMSDPRLGAQLNHYDTVLSSAGVHPNVKLAVSEIGQADPNTPGISSYLDTIPGKYPEIVGDSHVMELFNTKRKEAAASELQRQAKEAGLVSKSATINAPGGNLTLSQEKTATLPQVAAHQKAFDDAQVGLTKAHAQAEAFRSDPNNKGKPMPSGISGNIQAYHQQVEKTGQRLAKADASLAESVVNATEESNLRQNQYLGQLHDELESNLKDEKGNWKTGEELTAAAKEINAVKSKLGYDLIDTKTGAVIPGSAPKQSAKSPTASKSTADHDAAIQWAKEHPDDPRAAVIRERNGL